MIINSVIAGASGEESIKGTKFTATESLTLNQVITALDYTMFYKKSLVYVWSYGLTSSASGALNFLFFRCNNNAMDSNGTCFKRTGTRAHTWGANVTSSSASKVSDVPIAIDSSTGKVSCNASFTDTTPFCNSGDIVQLWEVPTDFYTGTIDTTPWGTP